LDVERSAKIQEGARARTANYAVLREVIAADRMLPIPFLDFRLARPTIVVFADDKPLYNWGHPCRYLLYDAESCEQYAEVCAQFPPVDLARDAPLPLHWFHRPIALAPELMHAVPSQPSWKPRSRGRRYAVLFSGMSNRRHLNDLEFLYRTLVNVYGFARRDITVLNFCGQLQFSGIPEDALLTNPIAATTWAGDGSAYQMSVKGPGSRLALLGAIDDLKSRLKADDTLLLYTGNHGARPASESFLLCHPWGDKLGVDEFTGKLCELPKFQSLIVVMQQCFAGGFNAPLITRSPAKRTSIASACSPDGISSKGEAFDPFSSAWIAAMAGVDPYGGSLYPNPDTNGDGVVSAREAFEYASAKVAADCPLFSEAGGGGSSVLGRELVRWAPASVLISPAIRNRWSERDETDSRVNSALLELESLAQEAEAVENEVAERYWRRVEEILAGVEIS
jgi:hypothetical protein